MRLSSFHLALMLAFGLLVMVGQPVSAAFLPNVVKACLPIDGRMKRDRTQACHCPPKEFCGTGKLSPYLESTCCQGPCTTGDCDFGFMKVRGTECPGCAKHSFTREHDICTAARVQFDPSTAPEGMKASDVQPAVLAYNECMTTCDASWIRRTPADDGDSYSTAHDIADMLPRNTEKAVTYFACAKQCRADMAETLSISLPAEDTMVKYDEFAQTILTLSRDDVIADDRDNCTNFEGDGSACLSNQGKPMYGGERAFDFLDGAAELPQDDNFDDTFDGFAVCRTTVTPQLCGAAIGNDGRSCNTCLAPETGIALADGTQTPINQIKAGDMVKTADGNTAKVEEVVITDWPVLTLYSINQGQLELTADHPVMTTIGWRAVDYYADQSGSIKKYTLQDVPQLKVGDTLVTLDGEIIVESIEPMETRTNAKTYNLKLEGGDSFYAGGVLVKDN